jgi:anaerobic magnesium-protoporphyrin IX monomethyl ester cyclase
VNDQSYLTASKAIKSGNIVGPKEVGKAAHGPTTGEILFIKMSQHIGRFPLGYAYLVATVKEKTKFGTALFDEAYHVHRLKRSNDEIFGEFKKVFAEVKPTYVGFSLFQEEVEQFLKYATYIKEHAPNCQIIVGGNDASTFGEHMIKNIAEIDLIVRSEGELVLAQILNGDNLYEIPNIAFRDEAGEVVVTKPIMNYNYPINDLPRPAREEFDMEMYASSVTQYFRFRKTVTVLMSRGCTGNCSFCVSRTIYGLQRNARAMSMMEEVEEILEKYPYVENLYFTDNYFPLDNPEGREFLEMWIEKGLHKRLSFGCQIRLKAVTADSVKLLKKANCSYVGLGIENHVPHIVKNMAKNWKSRTGERWDKTAKLLKKSGLFVNYYYILNYPGMTYADLKENMDMIRRYNICNASLASLAPNPRTRIFDTLAKDDTIPSLEDPQLNWRTDFINGIYRSRDWIGLTPEQQKEYDDFIKERQIANRKYYLWSLPLKYKLRIAADRIGLNPLKAVRWIFTKVLFYRPPKEKPSKRTNSVVDGPMSNVWAEDYDGIM